MFPTSIKLPKTTIVIADDHTFYREGLVNVLNQSSKYQVVGQAANGEQLVDLACQHDPDVMIVDITMPVLNGIDAMNQLKTIGVKSKAIVLTMHSEDMLLKRALDAGAMCILDKTTPATELYEAIDTITQHNRLYFPAATHAKMLALLKMAKYKLPPIAPPVHFTPREMEIIQLVCQDLGNKEIGNMLQISPRTVETHRAKLIEKMNVKTAAGLVAYAFSHGFISVTSE
jgi:DNA-binding NarL/FixJ family response regulator